MPDNFHFCSKQANYIIAPVCLETYNTGVSFDNFHISSSNQGSVESIQKGWRLSIPAGKSGTYRLAQLDDYGRVRRRAYAWNPPFRIDLRARASSSNSPGTFGFGLWNDPFGLSLGFGGGQRLPTLPNAAWFFFASKHNHLSLRDDIPDNGALAATYQSQSRHLGLFLLASSLTPLLLLRPASRTLRNWAARVIRHDAIQLKHKPHEWHSYAIAWEERQVQFFVDQHRVFETSISPFPPLGLVLWVDNQFAAWQPDGKIAYGLLANKEEFSLEIRDLQAAH